MDRLNKYALWAAVLGVPIAIFFGFKSEIHDFLFSPTLDVKITVYHGKRPNDTALLIPILLKNSKKNLVDSLSTDDSGSLTFEAVRTSKSLYILEFSYDDSLYHYSFYVSGKENIKIDKKIDLKPIKNIATNPKSVALSDSLSDGSKRISETNFPQQHVKVGFSIQFDKINIFLNSFDSGYEMISVNISRATVPYQPDLKILQFVKISKDNPLSFPFENNTYTVILDSVGFNVKPNVKNPAAFIRVKEVIRR